jgi:hypothetical protein
MEAGAGLRTGLGLKNPLLPTGLLRTLLAWSGRRLGVSSRALGPFGPRRVSSQRENSKTDHT